MRSIRIFVVGGHALFREGVKATLGREPDLFVIGEAANGAQALLLAKQLDPDIVVMDLELPNSEGVQAIRLIRKQYPRSAILGMAESPDRFLSFSDLGVAAFLPNNVRPESLMQTVRDLATKQTPPSPPDPTAAPVSASDRTQLTSREDQVLKVMVRTTRNKEIAAELGISVRTVEKYRAQVMKKLNVDNVAALIRQALSRF